MRAWLSKRPNMNISPIHDLLKKHSNPLKAQNPLFFKTHDLIHKAVGWMLREAGKKDERQLLVFLDTHAVHMPRTMLRYSVEKLSSDVRAYYMQKR